MDFPRKKGGHLSKGDPGSEEGRRKFPVHEGWAQRLSGRTGLYKEDG
jgi:hypothetical protein